VRENKTLLRCLCGRRRPDERGEKKGGLLESLRMGVGPYMPMARCTLTSLTGEEAGRHEVQQGPYRRYHYHQVTRPGLAVGVRWGWEVGNGGRKRGMGAPEKFASGHLCLRQRRILPGEAWQPGPGSSFSLNACLLEMMARARH
jgi:hypothetical protein